MSAALVSYAPDGHGGCKAFMISVALEKERSDAWRLKFYDPPPTGLIPLQVDRHQVVAWLTGPGAALFSAFGTAEVEVGNFAAAEEANRKAVAVRGATAGKYGLARALIAQKQILSNARTLVDKALAVVVNDKESTICFDTLWAVSRAEGDADKAIDVTARAIAREPKNPAFHARSAKLVVAREHAPPGPVLRHFYAALAQNDDATAEEMTFELSRKGLHERDQLEATYQRMAAAGPFTDIPIGTTVRHDKLARLKNIRSWVPMDPAARRRHAVFHSPARDGSLP